MPDLAVWPTDGADGSVSSEARWRKMARLWVPSGIDMQPGAVTSLQPTLVAGPTINVAAGACYVDGHYCELSAPASVNVTANGLLVVRFTPADNHAELLWRDAATTPTQTDPTWELPIASMTAGAMTDLRCPARLGGNSAVPSIVLRSTAAHVAVHGTTAIQFNASNSAEGTDPYGMHDPASNPEKVFLPWPGVYNVAFFVAWAATTAGQYRQAYIRNLQGTTITQQLLPVVTATPNAMSAPLSGALDYVSTGPISGNQDWVGIQVAQDSGVSLNVNTFCLSVHWIGPAPRPGAPVSMTP